MIEEAIKFITQFYRNRTIAFCLFVATSVMLLDYITGEKIRFPILYVIPVGMAAWQYQKHLAYVIAIILPLIRIGFHLPWGEIQAINISMLNAPIYIIALVIYAYLVERIAWQARELKKKVNILEGILPICSSCKRIRNEKGEYEQIEKYITEHSEASFSHGICSECVKKLYPEFIDDNEI